MSHLEASNAETAQSKYVDNENLEFLTRSAVYLLSAMGILFPNKQLKGFKYMFRIKSYLVQPVTLRSSPIVFKKFLIYSELGAQTPPQVSKRDSPLVL